MAVRFDLDRLEILGVPVPVIQGLRQPFNGLGAFSCSNVGSCVYVAGATLRQRTVSLVDRTGNAQLLPLAANSDGHPRFSPKGDKLSFWMQQIRCDIEVYDIARGSTTRLTAEGDNHAPVWTPDGLRITYLSATPGTAGYELLSKPSNGSGAAEPLSEVPLKLGPVGPLTWRPMDRPSPSPIEATSGCSRLVGVASPGRSSNRDSPSDAWPFSPTAAGWPICPMNQAGLSCTWNRFQPPARSIRFQPTAARYPPGPVVARNCFFGEATS